MATTTTLDTLKINVLTQEQYGEALEVFIKETKRRMDLFLKCGENTSF